MTATERSDPTRTTTAFVPARSSAVNGGTARRSVAAWPEPRTVEEFAVRYRLRATVPVEVEKEDDARRAALRLLNARLAGTRYARIAWDGG